MDYLVDRVEAARLNNGELRVERTAALPEGAGPADWWLAVLIDPTASAQRRDEAARELRRLGARAIREAQDRRSAMEEDRWWSGLTVEEQRELLRKGQGP